jgi:hypothetical protein
MQISVSSRPWYAILCDTMSTACHTRQARCLHAVQLRGVGGAGLGRVGGLVRLWRTTDRSLTAPPAVYTLLLRPFRAGIMRVGNLPRPGCLKNCRCATAKKTPPRKNCSDTTDSSFFNFQVFKCSKAVVFFACLETRSDTFFLVAGVLGCHGVALGCLGAAGSGVDFAAQGGGSGTGGLAMGSGTGGLQTCEACLSMGLASPRWVGGRWGTPPPHVWTRVHYIKIGGQKKSVGCPTKKKMARKNTSDCVSQSVKNPQFLNI